MWSSSPADVMTDADLMCETGPSPSTSQRALYASVRHAIFVLHVPPLLANPKP
jgi:hypothetical protein